MLASDSPARPWRLHVGSLHCPHGVRQWHARDAFRCLPFSSFGQWGLSSWLFFFFFFDPYNSLAIFTFSGKKKKKSALLNPEIELAVSLRSSGSFPVKDDIYTPSLIWALSVLVASRAPSVGRAEIYVCIHIYLNKHMSTTSVTISMSSYGLMY